MGWSGKTHIHVTRRLCVNLHCAQFHIVCLLNILGKRTGVTYDTYLSRAWRRTITRVQAAVSLENGAASIQGPHHGERIEFGQQLIKSRGNQLDISRVDLGKQQIEHGTNALVFQRWI